VSGDVFCLKETATGARVAERQSGRGILGVVDGERPKGVETEADANTRVQFLRKIGYKR
jgi:adenosine/AMP kinase